MAERRYYWLRLKENFFQEDAIEWLGEQGNGTEHVLFYLKLCLKSLKYDGVLIRKVGTMLVPYDEKSLSQMTNTNYGVVVESMELLQKMGLVERMEDGSLFIRQVRDMVGTESTSAQRKRNSRTRLECDDVTLESQKCHKNVTTEIEIEKEKDIETEREVEKDIEIDRKRNKEREKKKEREGELEKSEPIDYQRVVGLYNDTCVSFPPLSNLSQSRRAAIKDRIQGGYSYEDLRRLFEKAERSDFLKGNNSRGWVANFDWLMKDGNAEKVLEGNYDDSSGYGTYGIDYTSVPRLGTVI